MPPIQSGSVKPRVKPEDQAPGRADLSRVLIGLAFAAACGATFAPAAGAEGSDGFGTSLLISGAVGIALSPTVRRLEGARARVVAGNFKAQLGVALSIFALSALLVAFLDPVLNSDTPLFSALFAIGTCLIFARFDFGRAFRAPSARAASRSERFARTSPRMATTTGLVATLLWAAALFGPVDASPSPWLAMIVTLVALALVAPGVVRAVAGSASPALIVAAGVAAPAAALFFMGVGVKTYFQSISYGFVPTGVGDAWFLGAVLVAGVAALAALAFEAGVGVGRVAVLRSLGVTVVLGGLIGAVTGPMAAVALDQQSNVMNFGYDVPGFIEAAAVMPWGVMVLALVATIAAAAGLLPGHAVRTR